MSPKQSYKAISVLFSRVESWHCHSVGQLAGPPLWSRLSCVRLTFWVYSISSLQLLDRLPWNVVPTLIPPVMMNCNNFNITVHCCALVKRHFVTVDSCWEKYVSFMAALYYMCFASHCYECMYVEERMVLIHFFPSFLFCLLCPQEIQPFNQWIYLTEKQEIRRVFSSRKVLYVLCDYLTTPVTKHQHRIALLLQHVLHHMCYLQPT